MSLNSTVKNGVPPNFSLIYLFRDKNNAVAISRFIPKTREGSTIRKFSQ